MIVKKISLIACFAMMAVLLQANPALSGMIDNMLDDLPTRTVPVSPVRPLPVPQTRQQDAAPRTSQTSPATNLPVATPAPVAIDTAPRPVVRSREIVIGSDIPAQELPARPLKPQPASGRFNAPLTGKVDEIVVFKAKRLLELRQNGQTVRQYRIALGRNPIGHKLYQGDNRTPEGRYRIDMRNAGSNYFRSLRISYPDANDQDMAQTLALRPGDWIMIHGLKNGYSAAKLGHPNRDWTNGCIALDNAQMAELWDVVPTGTPIVIWP